MENPTITVTLAGARSLRRRKRFSSDALDKVCHHVRDSLDLPYLLHEVAGLKVTDRLHVITGGPGSGKSTLIEALAAAGVATSAEVGRAIIKEELATGGTALPWRDHRAFAERMIEREIQAHRAALARRETVVLDRGVPDVIGFLRISGLAVPQAIDAAARSYRYNPRVFIAPWWADIFTTDAERKQTPEEARATFGVMLGTYRDYGYRLVELPRATVAERVAFVRREIGDKS